MKESSKIDGAFCWLPYPSGLALLLRWGTVYASIRKEMTDEANYYYFFYLGSLYKMLVFCNSWDKKKNQKKNQNKTQKQKKTAILQSLSVHKPVTVLSIFIYNSA